MGETSGTRTRGLARVGTALCARLLRAAVLLTLFLAAAGSAQIGAQEFFWELPRVLAAGESRIPQVATGGDTLAVLTQEFVRTNPDGGVVYLNLMLRRGTGSWEEKRRFAGPIAFVGNEARIASLAVDARGSVFVAYADSDAAMKILTLRRGEGVFALSAAVSSTKAVFSPRLFVKEDGELILYGTQEYRAEATGVTSSAISYSVSTSSGTKWSSFAPLVSEPELSQNFLPHHASHRGREYVVFQVLDLTERPANFQLYLKTSQDGGRTWTVPQLLTDYVDPGSGEGVTFRTFDNQRPFITGLNGTIAVTWERRLRRNYPQVYYMEIRADGTRAVEPERVAEGPMTCNYPQIAVFDSKPVLLWFDNRAGDDHVILAARDGRQWRETDLSRDLSGSSIFGTPVSHGGDLYVFWENQAGTRSRLMFLETDKTVSPPTPRGVNFTPDRHHRQDNFIVRWNEPEDSSGILGFSYSFDTDPDGEPEKRLLSLRSTLQGSFSADTDGWWYFHVRAIDYAGNWSRTATIRVFRDTTPPGKVSFPTPEFDEAGFLLSNTVRIRWDPPSGDDDIAGYSYSLRRLGPSAMEFTEPPQPREPSGAVLVTDGGLDLYNADNGLWALSVSAVDSVGNVGAPEQILFRLNKYIPVTRISSLRVSQDEMGTVAMRIVGRGFIAEGTISDVILDDDGKAPYLYSFSRDSGLFRVLTDETIDGPRIEEISEGTYRIGLVHPKRGTYFSGQTVRLDASGTVKFGDFSAIPSGTWKTVERKGAFLPFNTIILGAVMLFLAAMAVFSAVRIPSVVAEGKHLERTVVALIAGEKLSPEEKRKRIPLMKKRGMGLRVKFSVLVTSLIFAVVLLVSIPLGTFMIETQQQNLAQGLRKQAEVLLESLASGARTYLPLQRTLELRLLPNQRSAMTDSLFVTITGEGSQDPTRFEYVWASDDPSILEKIEGEALLPGLSYLDDEVTPEIETLKNEIDAAALAAVSGIVAEMERLNEQTRPLVSRLIRGEDPETRAALSALQDEIQSLEIELNSRLNEVGSAIHTIPEFSVENFDLTTEAYIFFKPIVYRSSQKGVYYNGMVRLGVSTKSIIGQIEAARRGLIIRTGLIAFLAIIIGIGGSLLLATIIIIPIKVLVRGVERIRDTEDKEELHDHAIAVKTRDEISELAETINQMTHGLVLAAKASKELTVGKEVQKMFIPLETDAGGKKLSTGRQESADFEFFGYYEGAKGVSGDYFDFKKLDENHYAVMKCDVAGKGVSASLIMVQVATLFINYFNSWQLKKDGLNLQKLVYTINDLVEERKFTGRFAAFTMGILNVKTGEATLCNAGDKLVHIYDASKGEMLVKELPAAPAVGVFPSSMVEMKSGFTQVRQVLDHGDTLFLFTDGIEEAKRNFRDSSFKQIVCDEPGISENGLHGNHQKGAGNEEMGMDRIHGIVEAVFKKGSFDLSKFHNPVPGEILSFDFSSCAGTAEDAVLALIAVEKVFRLYRDPKASSQDRVTVDRKVDQFLKEHFLRYADFFSNPVEDPRNKEYVYFPGLKEDEQYDDLTILAIRKK